MTNNLLQQFTAKPFAGQFLVVSEYRDGHGGGTACVVDGVTVPDDWDDDEDDSDVGHKRVRGYGDAALYDSIVEFEIWPNGEVYLSGDGLNHPRYRVTGLLSASVKPVLEHSSDLTEANGEPVWWHVAEFTQESHPDQPGTRVEMGIWHHLQTMRPGWEFRKAFGDAEELTRVAAEEFEKPKYYSVPRAIRVDGRVVRSWSAEFMAAGHELEGKE